MNENMIILQKTNSCLLENNTKVLGNHEADVNNQMSRKYKEENIRCYLKRFSGFDADTEGRDSVFRYIKNKVESSCCFCL